jgi:hypothetical protein
MLCVDLPANAIFLSLHIPELFKYNMERPGVGRP